MKSLKFLSVLLTSIFLLTVASATAYYGTFIDGSGILSQAATITDGDSIDFEVDFISSDPSINLNVKLYNSTYDLIHTFEDNTVPTDPSYKIYTITPAIYSVPGTYKIIVFGYATELTLTVNAEVAPVITLTGSNPLTLEAATTYVEQGATALDDIDGDVTSSIITDSSSVNMNLVGSYSVTYDVTDSVGNNAAQVIRTVNVVDTTAPVITLIGSNPSTLEAATIYVEQGANASDSVDGDITASIVTDSSNVNMNLIGIYNVTYNVTDSAGNNAAQVIRTVNVVDTTAPVIILIGSNPFTVDIRGTYVERGFIATDSYDGDITSSVVVVSSDLNTGSIGTYHITYDVTDSAGNNATQVTRTVRVVSSGDDDDDDWEEYKDYYRRTPYTQKESPVVSETIYLQENSARESSWFRRFIESIVNFFRRLFGIN